MPPDETPHTDEILGIEAGEFYLTEVDEQGGVVSTTKLDAEQTLAWVSDEIEVYGPYNVPVMAEPLGTGGVAASRVATLKELEDAIASLSSKIYEENDRDDSMTIAAIRRALTSPAAIRLIVSAPGTDPAVVRAIWPNLDEVLAGKKPDGTANDTAVEGDGRQGPGGRPGGRGEDTTGIEGVAGSGGGVPGGGSVGDAASAGDPVLPFSGQLLIEATDLEIPGIGLDFRFRRTYLHATLYDGPLGPRWDHSYNLWLREAVEPRRDGSGFEHVVYRSSGSLAAQRFVAETLVQDGNDPAGIADATFVPDDGEHDRLVKQTGRFTMITPDGLEIAYGDHLRAESLRDREGNELRLEWDGEPLRLRRIVDTCDRELRLSYDVEARLVRLHDASLGRDVHYGYGSDGRLETVRRSVLPGRPAQLAQAYRYWGDEAPPGLGDNILGITDARRHEVLQIAYGDEPGLVSYNRVVEQRDGGVTRFEYEYVFDPDPDAPSDRSAAAVLRARMRLPGGSVQELDYNVQGRLVRQALSDRPEQVLETRWRYNEDGRVVLEMRPDGSTTEYEYGREIFARSASPESATAAERARFGELRRVIEGRRPTAAGPDARITEFDYDPRFSQIVEQRGPYYADALGNRVDSGPAWNVRLAYDSRGNLTGLRHPDCTLPDGSVQTGRGIDLEVDARGRLTRRTVTLEDGTTLATELAYDSDTPEPKAEIADADGLARRREFEHDAAGRTTEIRDPGGLRVVRSFDHLGRMLREEETAAGAVGPAVTELEWDAGDRPIRRTLNRVDAAGTAQPGDALIEDFEFDVEGDVTRSTVRSGDGTIDRATEYERDADRRLVALRSAEIETRMSYDGRGLPVRQELRAAGAAAATTRFDYDQAGRITRVVGPSGLEERMEYDGFGRLARRVEPGGTEESSEWDAADRLVQRVVTGAHPDAQGTARLFEERRSYDEGGRTVALEVAQFDPADPAAGETWATTRCVYDRADRLVRLIEPGGLERSFVHDGLDRVVRAADGGYTVARSSFDDTARTVEHEIELSGVRTDGTGFATTFASRATLDGRGNVIERRDGLGNVSRHEYDSRSQLTATVGPSGTRRELSMAPDGATREVVLAPGSPDECRWSYARDGAGRVAAVDGPSGRVLEVERDGFGRVTRSRVGDVAGREETHFRYDAGARLIESVDASGLVTRYDYSSSGAVRRASFDSSGVTPPVARQASPAGIDYEYDGAGGMVRADDGATPVDRRYDSVGRLLSETVSGRTVRWSYDAAGRPAAFSYSDGRRLEYARASDGRLERIDDLPAGTGTAATELLRLWPLGLDSFSAQRWRGAVARDEQRDAAARLIACDERRVSDGAALLELRQLACERGIPAVRRTTVGGHSETQLVELDGQGRLVGVAFDAALAVDVTGLDDATAGVAQADHDSAIGQLRNAAAPGEELAVELEADGARLRRRRSVGGSLTEDIGYTTGAAGRTSATTRARTDDADGLPLSLGGFDLSYDAVRRLVSEDQAGATVAEIERDALGRPHRIAVAGGYAEITYDGVNPVEAHGPGGASGQVVRLPGGEPVEVGDSAAPLRALIDGEGSCVGLADASGAVTAHALRDPFGELRSDGGTWPPLARTWQGMLDLPGSGLFAAGSRTYDPLTGAFLECDPALFPDGPNAFAYARSNPLAFADPSGLMAVPQGQTGQAAGTGAVNGSMLPFALGGTKRELEWYERFIAAVGGAVWSIANIFIEAGKQVYDLGGYTGAWFGEVTEFYKYEHEAVSGIGRMAEQGMGTVDIFKGMGRNIIETPGRVLDAAERGDYGGFGYEAMNLYMLGRATHGLAKGSASFAFNRGVGALELLGPRGTAWRTSIRARQVASMERAAMKVVRSGEPNPTTPKFTYDPTLPRRVSGEFDPSSNTVLVGEGAFRPTFLSGLRGPQPGGYGGSFGSRFRLLVGNVLRGNVSLRTLVHEGWHAQQFMHTTVPQWNQGLSGPYQLRPFEFTQPGSKIIGAWNFELRAPAGLFSTGLGASSVLNQIGDPVADR